MVVLCMCIIFVIIITNYIIFLMKKRYAQPLDKRTLTGGTVEEFKRFLEEKTGKSFRRVK